MHGHPDHLQLVVLSEVVMGQVVHDLGAGDGRLSHMLLVLGASSVVAVEKDSEWWGGGPVPAPEAGVTWVRSYFSDYQEPIDVAFVSWPENGTVSGCGLSDLVARARLVVYLGKNTDGIVCGNQEFWRVVTKREVIAYVPHQKNTLIVYGPARGPRELRGEEHAAIHDQKICKYEDIEKGNTPCAETSGISN